MGGFAAAYDLISAEYGWTDKVIGKLPLGRFRQIAAAIQTRKYNETRIENGRFSWMTRTIATYIAQGYMVEKGKPNPALEQAVILSLDEVEAKMLGATAAEAPKAKENAPGSFEKFMTMLGSGGKQRGQ